MPIPAYGTAETLALLQQRFGYIFEQPKGGSGSLYRPLLQAQVINGSFTIEGVLVRPFVQDHGFGATTTGYRLGRMAYSTDVVDLDDAAFAVLADLDLWVVDCLRYEPHPTHAHFDLTMSWIARAKPQRAILTHLNHMISAAAASSIRRLTRSISGSITCRPARHPTAAAAIG